MERFSIPDHTGARVNADKPVAIVNEITGLTYFLRPVPAGPVPAGEAFLPLEIPAGSAERWNVSVWALEPGITHVWITELTDEGPVERPPVDVSYDPTEARPTPE